MALSKYYLGVLIVAVYWLVANSNSSQDDSVIYREHRIRTDQLCPDLQDSITVKDIDTANYPYKSIFRFADEFGRTADPCVFEAKGPRRQYTTVIIKAIQAEYRQWNYSGASPCPEHIKLKLPTRRIFSKVGLPLCTIKKPVNPLRPFPGPFYHPHVWQLSKQKMGISFATDENETVSNQEELSNEITANPATSLETNLKGLPKFVHIVFATFFGDRCSIRVQQYLVDPNKEFCNSSSRRFYALCGMYNCSEEETVLRQARFWSDSLSVSEMHKLVEYIRTRKLRRTREPSLMDFFLNLMRLMIMPTIFLIAYFVTRQLREKLANRRQILNNLREISNQAYSPRPPLPMMLVESPSAPRFDDLPPPYESILTPPSYQEATQNEPKFVFPKRDDGDSAEEQPGLRACDVDNDSYLPNYDEIIVSSSSTDGQLGHVDCGNETSSDILCPRNSAGDDSTALGSQCQTPQDVHSANNRDINEQEMVTSEVGQCPKDNDADTIA